MYCQELKKEFATKEEMFLSLKANENKIISIKKAQIFKSAEKGQICFDYGFIKDEDASKAGLVLDNAYNYPVINTTWYLDGHGDVHKNGIWKKTIKDQVGKIFYISGHKFEVEKVIAWPEDVEVFTKTIPWALVGKNYEGETEALIFKIAKEKITKEWAKEVFESKRKIQGSVAMIYVKIDLAIDSKEKDYILNKQIFDANIDFIANKDIAKERGYFWLVSEAKIAREGSMVLQGSNDATEAVYPEGENDEDEDEDKGCRRKPKKENIEPSDDTQKNIEPPKGTQKKIDYKLLNEKFNLTL